MSVPQDAHVVTEALHILRTLYQLSTELFSSESRQDLIFRILNSTIRLLRYRRAVLWSFKDKRPKLLGVSGQEDVNDQSPLATLWRDIISSIQDQKKVQVLDGTAMGPKKAWQNLAKKISGLSVMWVPMLVNGKVHAGIWLERWGEDVWGTGECEIMNAFAQNLSLAWKQFNPPSRWHDLRTSLLQRKAMAVAGLIMVYLLFFQTVSLRVVAPCEIVPDDPVMIAAPLEGVIEQVWVQPGDRVKQGDLLFTYEDRIVMQELKVAQKEVEIIRSEYNRMRLRAFQDDEAMEKIQSLKYRLEQEEIRLKLAESNSRHLEVRAPTDGICMLDNPEHWQGRPVQIGERVLKIFLPEKSKVRIFLPENDYIQFDREKPVRVVLNCDPGSKYEARLDYVAPQTSKNPQGGASFIAEAGLPTPDARIRVGSKGSAIVHGREVPTGYWLIRKPLAGIRHFLGA